MKIWSATSNFQRIFEVALQIFLLFEGERFQFDKEITQLSQVILLMIIRSRPRPNQIYKNEKY